MRASHLRFAVPLLALVSVALLLPGDELAAITGFTPEHSQAQRATEAKFLAVPDPKNAEMESQILTAEPHVAGSPADRKTADYMLEQFKRFGIDAAIEEYDVLLPDPQEVSVDVLDPVNFHGPRPEGVPGDPASNDKRTIMPFNAYSASGDVTAEAVYVHYGLPADYARLKELGVSVEGKIAVARYGGSFRGVKAMVAQENHAAGLIIYSDPDDDGYHVGDTYPDGPWRPASGVQRGSVLFLFGYAGDPTTPDGPSLPGAKRIDPSQSTNMPRIPVAPLSYGDAQNILRYIEGPVAPREWHGGLPLTYHLGPGPAKVHLKVRINYQVKPIWNVIAKIPGRERPDEIVVLGNHRDAWTYGAVDPNSGTTALLEVARGLGALLRDGWRPRRSLWLCSWDGEEEGLMGSTEWGEAHAAELEQKAVAYLNLDVAVAGDQFSVNAVPSLKEFVRETAASVPDPRGGTVLEQAEKRLREELRRSVVPGSVPSEGTELTPIAERTLKVGNLGSGSDYTVFLDHLGIPSTDFSFTGSYGVYHSIFDNHRWMEKFGDPHWTYHVAAAGFYGLEALRLADADLLPLNYEDYGKAIQDYLAGISRKLALLGQGTKLDLSATTAAADRLEEAGRKQQEEYGWAVAQGMLPQNLDAMNRALVTAEQAFLLPDGLPGRPWFRHSIFAPGTYTGYAAVPLPGVHESIDAGEFTTAQQQLDALTAAINRATATLNGAR